MNLTCPSCGCSGDEELFGADHEWRMAMNETLAMPSNCAEGVKRYLRLFRPLKRNLTPSKARRLLAELREMICADELVFDRQTYRIPAHVWEAALNIMVDKQNIQRPIANHNYLKKVAIGLISRDDRPVPTPPVVQHVSEPKEEEISLPSDSETYKALQLKAEAELQNEGIQPQFIVLPLIEGKMREIIRRDQVDGA